MGDWELCEEKGDHPGGALLVHHGPIQYEVTRGKVLWLKGKRKGLFHGIARADDRKLHLLFYVREGLQVRHSGFSFSFFVHMVWDRCTSA